jgi:hypothetical protein
LATRYIKIMNGLKLSCIVSVHLVFETSNQIDSIGH